MQDSAHFVVLPYHEGPATAVLFTIRLLTFRQHVEKLTLLRQDDPFSILGIPELYKFLSIVNLLIE